MNADIQDLLEVPAGLPAPAGQRFAIILQKRSDGRVGYGVGGAGWCAAGSGADLADAIERAYADILERADA